MRQILFSSIAAIAAVILLSDFSDAQQSNRRYRYDSTMPPGAVGQMQLMRRSAMRGHVQPVQLLAPEGSKISVFDGGAFHDLGSSKVTVGMLIGQTYRIKVTQIPGKPGLEVFPSVEVINRLYPPPGLQLKFPIQIDLAEHDLTTAAGGSIVTRVVYLENPEDAMPARQLRDEQPYFDVSPGNDPLKVAQQLGRPMAIVRCGTITPDGIDLHAFSFGSPPVQLYPTQLERTHNPAQEDYPAVGSAQTLSDEFHR